MEKRAIVIVASGTALVGSLAYRSAAPDMSWSNQVLLVLATLSMIGVSVGIYAAFEKIKASARERWDVAMHSVSARLGMRYRDHAPTGADLFRPLIGSRGGVTVHIFAEVDEGAYNTKLLVQLPGVSWAVLAGVKRLRISGVRVWAAQRAEAAPAAAVGPVEIALRALGRLGVSAELDHSALNVHVAARTFWNSFETNPDRICQVVEAALDVAQPLAQLWAQSADQRSTAHS